MVSLVRNRVKSVPVENGCGRGPKEAAKLVCQICGKM
jgi:hypothetical protein